MTLREQTNFRKAEAMYRRKPVRPRLPKPRGVGWHREDRKPHARHADLVRAGICLCAEESGERRFTKLATVITMLARKYSDASLFNLGRRASMHRGWFDLTWTRLESIECH